MQVSPHLNFDGRCQEAFKFYEKVLGARIESLWTYEGSPLEQTMPPEWRHKVMHAAMTIGSGTLSGADAPPVQYRPPQGFSVTLELKNVLEAERIFAALAEGGKVQVMIQPTFWAARFGMVTDRFHIPWMLNCSQAV